MKDKKDKDIISYSKVEQPGKLEEVIESSFFSKFIEYAPEILIPAGLFIGYIAWGSHNGFVGVFSPYIEYPIANSLDETGSIPKLCTISKTLLAIGGISHYIKLYKNYKKRR